MKMTICQRCGKEIEHRGSRKYCTECRKIVDDERYQSHRKETKDEKIKRLEEENKKLREELEELKENNRVKKINEYDEEYVKANTLKECIKANTLKRDFSRQRIRELEEDLHMLRVENDMLRKMLRGEY